MAQLSKISKNNTTTTLDGHGRIDSVTLHHTRILSIDWGKGEITVNTGGHNTVTTQTRLNQAFNQLGLPFRAARESWNKESKEHTAMNILNIETGVGCTCNGINVWTAKNWF